MSKLFHLLLLAALIAAITVASYWTGQQAYHWLPPQATAEAQLVDNLFSFVITLATFIFLGIVGLLGYVIVTRRAAPEDISDGPPITGHPKLEVLWTVGPILLVLWIAIYSFQIYQQMGIEGPQRVVKLPLTAAPASAASTSEPLTTIEVTAKQWAWLFRYPQEKVTSTKLHLPVNRPVRLVMASEDVIHGFYVPAFRLKQDIVPNRRIDLAFTPTRIGQYRLYDSQFSGTYFALMAEDVYVDSPEQYRQWLSQTAAQPLSPTINPAHSEYHQQGQKGLKSNWPAVPPAAPPVVNQ